MLAKKQFNAYESAQWNEGWESFFIDRVITDNPYKKNTEAYSEWRSGFLAAKEKSSIT